MSSAANVDTSALEIRVSSALHRAVLLRLEAFLRCRLSMNLKQGFSLLYHCRPWIELLSCLDNVDSALLETTLRHS